MIPLLFEQEQSLSQRCHGIPSFGRFLEMTEKESVQTGIARLELVCVIAAILDINTPFWEY